MIARNNKRMIIINIVLFILLLHVAALCYVMIDASFSISIFGMGKYLRLSDIDSCIMFTKEQYFIMILAVCSCGFITLLTNYIYLLFVNRKSPKQPALNTKNKKHLVLCCACIFILNTAIVLMVCLICRHQIIESVMNDQITKDQIPRGLLSYYLYLLYLIPIFAVELILMIIYILKKQAVNSAYNVLFVTFIPYFFPILLLNPHLL